MPRRHRDAVPARRPGSLTTRALVAEPPEEEEATIVSTWTLVRFVHVLSAMVWVGGQLLISGVHGMAVIAFAEQRWGFRLLEGVWSVVSAVSLVGVLRPGQEGAGHG